MAIKLTDKKLRIVTLFITLLLIMHVFFTLSSVSKIIKQDQYSKKGIEKSFLQYDGIFKNYFSELYYYISTEDDYAKAKANGYPTEVIESIESKLQTRFSELKKYDGLQYYFIDENNVKYTNIDGNIDDYIKNESLYYVTISSNNIELNDDNGGRYLIGLGDSYIIKGYVIIPKILAMNSMIYDFLEKSDNQIIAARITLTIFVMEILSIIILALLIIKKKMYLYFKDDSTKFMKYYFKIIFEIRVVMILMSIIIMYLSRDDYSDASSIAKIFMVVYFPLFLQLLIYILLSYFNKNNSINNRDKSIFYNFYRNLRLAKNLKKMYFKLLFVIFFSMIIGSIILCLLMVENYGDYSNYHNYIDFDTYSNSMKFGAIVFLIIFFMIPLITYIMNKFLKIHNLIKSIEDIQINGLENDLNIKENDEFFNAYESIKNIKSSIEYAVEKRLRSERLKTELITNVSHDLKTPLTSIINYVDLMKKDNLLGEDYKSYLEIIDKKSKRLKVLIEDLLKASKLNSGDIELNKEKVDLVSLIKQTLGDFEKQIEDSDLELILKLPEEKVYLELDGKKIWRVFENILNNIFKYSQKNTRVYLDVIEYEKRVKVITKNISAYQLNINPEELFEKFKRGDEARNTEGSGLALSIARGIIELHGGEMKIQVDGDLFKNILIFENVDNFV